VLQLTAQMIISELIDQVVGSCCLMESSLSWFQGMNCIAGYLLIITRDEEKSFWLMDVLIGRILPGK